MEELFSIAIDIPVRKNFTYRSAIPLKVGQRVKVPFGNRKVLGWVVGPGIKGNFKCKDILKVYDSEVLIPEHLMKIAIEVAESCFCSLGSVLSFMAGNLSLRNFEIETDQFNQPETFSGNGHLLLSELLKKMENEKRKIGILKFSSPDEKEEFFLKAPLSFNGSCVMVFSSLQGVERFTGLLKTKYQNRIISFTGNINKTEKTKRWKRMLKDKNLIVIGTRICLFSPLVDLSAIIVDEPSDYGHKEERTPRYNSRELAIIISRILNIPVIFSLCQPDLADFFLIKSQEASLVESKNVVVQPRIIISQIKEKEWKNFLTETSMHLLEKTVIEKNRVAIIHKTKGYARLLFCKNCKSAILCPVCGNISSPVSEKYAYCDKCRKFFEIPSKCPVCKKSSLVLRQPGIQKVFEGLKVLYPDFDIGMISEKNRFFSSDTMIFLGTSHIINYLKDINPDLLIFTNGDTFAAGVSFRSEEKFFLIVEKIKRVMQGKEKTVIIQTRNPGLDVYGELARNQQELFYKREMLIREKLGFPPFGEFISIQISGRNWTKHSKSIIEELEKIGDVYLSESRKKKTEIFWKVSERKKAFVFLQQILERYKINDYSVDPVPYF